MLYWAEGTKSHEVIRFTNSDPAMIEFMMKWFREIREIAEEKFRVDLHIHSLHCKKDVLSFWSKIAKIPLSQLHKTQIKPTSLRHRKNKLYNGTCAINISNKDLFRKIKGWRIGFLEKLNIKYEYPAPVA